MAEAEVASFAGGAAAVFSARCPDKATPNEDAAALIPFGDGTGVLVEADGVGGETAGERAARLAVEAMTQTVAEASAQGHMLRTAILNGFEQANQSVQELGLGAATTLAAVEIDHGVMRPYHAGDSTILVVGGRGRVKLQTVSHSPVGYAVESGLLTPLDAMQHADRHLVSNVVGTPAMRIEIGPSLKLSPRDTILLASDGLHDNLHDEEIIERLRKGPLPHAIGRLADDARRRMNSPDGEQPCKPDDLTLVVFRTRKLKIAD
jgi:serine/threonine protein phosphatase PrpC